MDPENLAPFVGATVHFYRPGTPATEPLAALIAQVPKTPDAIAHGECVLYVLDLTGGVRFEASCYNAKPSPGCWCWIDIGPAAVARLPSVSSSSVALLSADQLKELQAEMERKAGAAAPAKAKFEPLGIVPEDKKTPEAFSESKPAPPSKPADTSSAEKK